MAERASGRAGERATSASSPELRIEDLSHTYSATSGSVLAIDQLSLSVAPGEFVCLLGPSGCGKSTLLRIVAGLLRPNQGRVERRYEEVMSGARREGLGWMAQRDGLLPWQTVLGNVSLPLKIGGLHPDRTRERASQALRLTGLERFARHYPHQLSGGMRQRAALARAIVHQPGLLLLDEPFAHLDELTREDLGDALVQLWTVSRPTTLLVTHSALEAVRLADRVVVLSPRPARVVAEVRPRIAQPRAEDHPATLEALQQIRTALQRSSLRDEASIPDAQEGSPW